MNKFTFALKPVAIGSTTVSEHLPGLREKFLGPEAHFVLVRYEGMLGTCVISEAIVLTRNGKYLAFKPAADAQLELRGLCDALLESRFSEWSKAEGAAGRFLWDLASDRMTYSHSVRYLHDFDFSSEGVAPSLFNSAEWSEGDIPF